MSPIQRPLVWSLVAALLVAGVGVAAWTQLDLDGDGLAAAAELAGGTSAVLADTDGDGLGDGWEALRRLSPLDADTDGDTIPDPDEIRARTDPLEADSDGDGLPDAREIALGTDPRSSDPDADGVPDALEIEVGTQPLLSDSDADGLDDGAELRIGSDPLAPDSDGDGIGDLDETRGPDTDCDADGVPAVADPDDDADVRPDADELPDELCNPDFDADGVLDGHELNPDCVRRPDCDVDGLDDALELSAGYDPLDPDTFGLDLPDAVAYAFNAAGQPPTPDGDGDGIPDGWEGASGLIDWGSFDPEPGRVDLLVEFVRVAGPDSQRFDVVDFRPVYDAIAAFFRDEGDVHLQWVETRARLGSEEFPPLIPSSDSEHYRDVLSQGRHSANPYVTTIVLNPQHDQAQLLHIGIAPIRSMIGAIDYGAHSWFEYHAGPDLEVLSPALEAMIRANRQDVIRAAGYEAGGQLDDGQFFLIEQDATILWRPYWFREAPWFVPDDGNATRMRLETRGVFEGQMAGTVVHELGHTLGLCHLQLRSCRETVRASELADLNTSTMGPATPQDVLHFLPSEWERLRTYVACPPEATLTSLAAGADDPALIEAKYRISLEDILDARARECGEFPVLARTLEPVANLANFVPSHAGLDLSRLGEPAREYEPPVHSLTLETVHNTATATVMYAVVVVVAAVGVGSTVGWIVHRRVHGRAGRQDDG